MERNSKRNFSVHKRIPTRELINAFDVRSDSSTARLTNSIGNPLWKRSFPHVCVATVSSFLFGYHLGGVNEPLESISEDLGFAGNTLEKGLVVSMCLCGAWLGCCCSGSLADSFGRRRAFQLSALLMIIGALLSAGASSLQGMLIGRFLVGTWMGVGAPVASLYVTEVSPSFVRGTYGSFIQIATCLGLITALLIGSLAKVVSEWWRVCFWVSAIPAALFAFGMEFCAESPLWLYKHGQFGEAELEFEKLLGGPHVKSSIAELLRSEKVDDSDGVQLLELLRGHHFRVIFIGSTLYAFQQLSGINAIFYFSATVLKNAGVPPDMANLCVGFANLSGSIIAMVLMDKLGRKVLLFGSFLGMAMSMGLQATAASFRFPGSGAMYMSVGGMLLFVLAFALGAGPVPGLLMAEMFSNRIRAKAMAVCMSIHWVVNFFVGLLFLQLLEKIGTRLLYSIFASFCLMAAAFVRRNVIETKGKSLQEIEIALMPPE